MSSGLTWAFSQSFTTQFQSSHRELETRIHDAKSAVSVSEETYRALSVELAKLSKDLSGAAGFLPSYDQRQLEDQLKVLEKSISELAVPSRKKTVFAFKRKAPISSSGAASPSSSSAKATIQPQQAFSFAAAAISSLSSHSHEYLGVESIPNTNSREGLSIHDLNSCVVNLVPLTPVYSTRNSLDISALHIRDLTETVILLPPVDGSILIHGLRRCTIFAFCHQFRMHSSHNVDVYLSVASSPIIEHCTEIRFGKYPENISGQAISESPSYTVLDFSHIRTSPSPNWSSLKSDQGTSWWPLSSMTPTRLDATLSLLLPQ